MYGKAGKTLGNPVRRHLFLFVCFFFQIPNLFFRVTRGPACISMNLVKFEVDSVAFTKEVNVPRNGRGVA